MIKKYVLYVDIDEDTSDVNIDGFESADESDYLNLIVELVYKYQNV